MKIIGGIITLVVVLGAGFVLLNNPSKKNEMPVQPTTKPTQAQQSQTAPSSTMQATGDAMTKKEVAVTLTTTDFEPKTITVKAGTKVVWTNKSGAVATVNSDPHPTHTNYQPLNLGRMNDGASVSLVFDKPGTYTYHNHLDASQTGIVVVK